MLTAVERREGDDVGLIWYEVFKNGKTTGYQYDALNADHAIRMYKQTNK